MKSRPDALGLDFGIESVDDVNAALHEMSWLTALQQSIEGPAGVKIEAIRKDANARLVVTIDEHEHPILSRWNALKNAIFLWCGPNLKDALPAGKKTLKLSHGEIKTRKNEAAVEMLKGKSPDDVAFDLARRAELLGKVDELLETKVEGIPLRKLIAVKFVLAKDEIKEEWARNPDSHKFLQSLAISVAVKEQITIVPATQQIATVQE